MRLQPPKPETLRGHKSPPEQSVARDAERLSGSAEGLQCRVPRIFFQLMMFPVFYVIHLVTNILITTNRAYYGVYMSNCSMKLTKCLFLSFC